MQTTTGISPNYIFTVEPFVLEGVQGKTYRVIERRTMKVVLEKWFGEEIDLTNSSLIATDKNQNLERGDGA